MPDQAAASSQLPVQTLRQAMGSASPLHAHLVSLLVIQGYPGWGDRDLDTIACGLAAIASLYPFDLARPVEVPDRGYHRPALTCSLLEAVLLLPPLYPESKREVRPRVRWQLEADGTVAPLKHDPSAPNRQMDLEWVCALFTAAGANPWREPDIEPGCVPHAFSQAIALGMAGLVEQFLACPGAPKAAALGDLACPGPRQGPSSPSNGSVWEQLMATPYGAAVLPVLVEAGLRLPTGPQAAQLLRAACPESIAALVACHPPLGLAEAQSRTVRNGWRERVKRGDLTPEQVNAMASNLWPGQVDSEMSVEAVEIARLVAVPWGKTPTTGAYHAHAFLRDVGARALGARTRIAAGPVAGQWNLLAAGLFSRMRQATNAGALQWSLPTMLGDQTEQAGSLVKARGFDWRPGIAIDGVLLMAALANGAWRDEAALATGLDHLTRALDVSNKEQWIQDHLPDAARFTIELLSRPSTGALTALNSVWGKIGQSRGYDLTQLDIELREKLFMALADPCWAAEFGGKAPGEIGGHFKAMFPGHELYPNAWKAIRKNMKGPELRALIHMAMLKDLSRPDPDLPKHLFALGDQLGQDELDQIEKFWVRLNDEQRTPTWRALIEQWRLDQNTAPVVSSPRNRGMRL